MSMSEANRHAQSKDPLHLRSTGRLAANFHHKPSSAPSDKHGGPFTARPPPKNIRASLGGRASRPSPHNLHPISCLLPRQHHHRLCARHHRRIRIRGRAIHVDHLPRLLRHQPHASRHHI